MDETKERADGTGEAAHAEKSEGADEASAQGSKGRRRRVLLVLFTLRLTVDYLT